MKLEEFPKELISKRNEIEGNFIMSLYKEPELIDDFSNIINGEDIITDDGCFYYGLAQNMYKMGYKVFDNVSINTYLKDKKVLKDGFERRGGYRTIQDITSILDVENIEANYDEDLLEQHIQECIDNNDDENKLFYLNRVKLTHLSSKQAVDFLLENMNENSEYIYLHKSSYNYQDID